MSTIVTSSTATGSSGTYYISGLSGLDTSALIEAAVEVKMQAAYDIDDTLEELDLESEAWDEMRDLLDAMSDCLADLASSADDDDYAFDTLTSYLTSTLDDTSDYIGVTVSDDAVIGTYDIVIEQIATTEKVSSDAQTEDAELEYEGSFTLGADGYDEVEVTVTSDMTISDIADAINDVSDETGITATLVTSSADGTQTLILTAVDTGLTDSGDQPIALTDTDGILEDLGLISVDTEGNESINVLQEAQNALLTVDGIEVESASNDIEDLITGVSINLYAATEGETIALEVDQDLSTVLEDIEAFVEAYNAYREWALTMQETDSSGATDDAVLFGETILRTANSAIYDLLASTVEVDGETWSLADLGIELDDDNYLTLDEDALEEALLQNADAVEALFCTGVTSDADDDLGIVQMGQNMTTGTYELVIEFDDDGDIESASINGVALEVSGTTLIGVDGTDYEDLYMYFSGDDTDEDGTETIEFTVNEGLADICVDTIDYYTNYTDGLITEELDSIDEEYEDLEEEREDIVEEAEEYEEYLIQYYAELEAKIEEAETALTYIETILNYDDDD